MPLRVFVSWSGALSHRYALLLDNWLPSVLQAVNTYVSSNNIQSGSRWNADIAKELATNSYGILCLTEESRTAPWLIFEAGALSKAVDSAHVVPLLFDLKQSDVDFPLAQFQMRVANRDDMHSLVFDINATTAAPIESQRLEEIFDVWWPKFELERTKILADSTEPARQAATQDDATRVLEEILEGVRSQLRILTAPEQLLPSTYLQQALQRSAATERVHPAAITDLLNGFSSLPRALSDITDPSLKLKVLNSVLPVINSISYILRKNLADTPVHAVRKLRELQESLRKVKTDAENDLSEQELEDEIPF